MENQKEGIENTTEIKQLFESDQEDRSDFSKDPSKGFKIRKRDEKRIKKAKEILAKGGNFKAEELNMLAFIFQHGDTIDDYKQALSLTTQAVERGLLPKHSLIPQVTDRLMIQEQLERGVSLYELKQKYGTQTLFNEIGKAVKPSLDGTISKEDFKKFGLEQ